MNQNDVDVIMQAADTLGAAVGRNVTNPTMFDRLVSLAYPSRRIQRDLFSYGITFAALAPANVQQGNIAIAADSDFVLLQMACHANIAGAAQTYQTETLPLVTVMLTDTSSGRQLFDIDQPISNLFGSARQPYAVPMPRLIPAKTLLQVKVTNFDAASTYNLRFSFIGAKIFDLGPVDTGM